MQGPSGDLIPWLEELEAQVSQSSARDAGFTLTPDLYQVFTRSLEEKRPYTRRLLQDILPRCDAVLLAGFTALVAGRAAEDALIRQTRERHRRLKKLLRSYARKDRNIRESVRELMEKAEPAFDVRREGLADSCFGALIIRRYLEFRSGIRPKARELAALLEAGFAASGRPRGVDPDLLRKNLRNYEKRKPHESAMGPECAYIIELTTLPLIPRFP